MPLTTLWGKRNFFFMGVDDFCGAKGVLPQANTGLLVSFIAKWDVSFYTPCSKNDLGNHRPKAKNLVQNSGLDSTVKRPPSNLEDRAACASNKRHLSYCRDRRLDHTNITRIYRSEPTRIDRKCPGNRFVCSGYGKRYLGPINCSAHRDLRRAANETARSISNLWLLATRHKIKCRCTMLLHGSASFITYGTNQCRASVEKYKRQSHGEQRYHSRL